MATAISTGITARIAQRASAAGSAALPRGEEPVVTTGRRGSDAVALTISRRMPADDEEKLLKPAVNANQDAAQSITRLQGSAESAAKSSSDPESTAERATLNRAA